MANRRIVTFLMVSLALLVSMVQCQKSYSVFLMDTTVYIGSSTDTCAASVVEYVTYNFTGQYSQVGRSVPFNIASYVSTSSFSSQMVTSGYSILSTSITTNSESSFLVTGISPSTPAGTTTSITIKSTYSLEGSVYMANVSFMLKNLIQLVFGKYCRKFQILYGYSKCEMYLCFRSFPWFKKSTGFRSHRWKLCCKCKCQSSDIHNQ